MKIYRYFIALSFILLSGCTSAKNLHFQDRIPHEGHKGYVQFECVYHIIDNGEHKNLNMVNHNIKRIEYNNDIYIYDAPIGNTTIPITDRPGEHIYIVKFPNKITLTQTGPNSFQQTVFLNNFSKGIITPSYPSTQTTANWYTKEEKISLEVKEDMVTLVKLDLSLTPEQNSNTYSGTLKYSVETPKPYLEKPIDIAQDSVGPKYYKNQYDEVFSSVTKTVEKLDWELDRTIRASGRVDTIVARFPGSPLVFTIIIHQSGDGQIQVDVSSDSGWQRWGSINTGISVEKISEFYQTLDHILLSDYP